MKNYSSSLTTSQCSLQSAQMSPYTFAPQQFEPPSSNISFNNSLCLSVSIVDNLMRIKRGSFKHLLNRPTAPHAIFKNATLKTLLSRPLSHRLGFTFISKQVIVRSVKILLPKGTPTTVLRSIILRGVNAVNRGIALAVNLYMLLIAFPHIVVKVLKNLPAFANSDSAPTITLKPIMLRIFTPLLHRAPNLVKARSRLSVFHSPILANPAYVVKLLSTSMKTV